MPKVGIRLPSFVLKEGNASPEEVKRYVRSVEELGYDSIFTIDHLQTAAPTYPVTWFDCLSMLSAIASVTGRVRFGPLVLVLPLYHPVWLAKALATIDFLSNGRLIVGLGVGWSKPEFDAMGIPLSSRGKIMDESLEILRELWTRDNVSFDGEFFRFHDVSIEPKPVQKPYPPIWIGGGNQPFGKIYGMKVGDVTPALGRIARYANGWSHHLSSSAEMISQDWKVISRLARQFGRNSEEIEIVYSNFIFVARRTTDYEKCKRSLARITTLAFEEAKKAYLIGTDEEIVRRLKLARVAAGRVDHIILNPLSWDLDQVRRVKDTILTECRANDFNRS